MSMQPLSVDPRTFDMQTVYIPRVGVTVTEKYIKEKFEHNDLANVHRVDFVFKYAPDGRATFKQAFVHLQWFATATAQRYRSRVESADETNENGFKPARLVHDDPHYWILLKANSPIPDEISRGADELVKGGDIGKVLDAVLTELGPAIADDEYSDVKNQFRKIGLAFNRLRQNQTESQRTATMSQTLLTGMSQTAEALRQQNWDLQWRLYHCDQERLRIGRVLHEESEKSERLLQRAEHLQQEIFEAKILCGKQKDTEQRLRNHIYNDQLSRVAFQRSTSRPDAPLRGNDPIAARANSSSPTEHEWDVIHGALDADTNEEWRLRRQYRYGEDTDSDDDDSCSSMPGLVETPVEEDDVLPTYTKGMHAADTRAGCAPHQRPY